MVVIGTLFKQMKMRPTVLLEYTADDALSKQIQAARFCDESDSLVLEDDSARIILNVPQLDVAKILTGTILAVRGRFDPKTGIFDVHEHLFAGEAQCFLLEMFCSKYRVGSSPQRLLSFDVKDGMRCMLHDTHDVYSKRKGFR